MKNGIRNHPNDSPIIFLPDVFFKRGSLRKIVIDEFLEIPYYKSMTVYENINALVGYAITTSLIQEDDIIYTKNRLLELFRLDGFESPEQAACVPKV